MFRFFKKKSQEGKKSKIDKLIMGAILGGAIGSVVGMSIAPKKGKETREYLNQKGKELFKKGQEVSQKFIVEQQDKISQTMESNPKILSKIANKLSRIKAKILHPFRKKTSLHHRELKQIPHEHVEKHENDIIKF